MTRDEAIAYVNEPGISPVERAQRKNEVFTVLYGRKSERHPLEQLVPEASPLRFIGEPPKYHEVDFYTGSPEGYVCQGEGCAICRMQEDTAFVPWLDRLVDRYGYWIVAGIGVALIVILLFAILHMDGTV